MRQNGRYVTSRRPPIGMRTEIISAEVFVQRLFGGLSELIPDEDTCACGATLIQENISDAVRRERI